MAKVIVPTGTGANRGTRSEAFVLMDATIVFDAQEASIHLSLRPVPFPRRDGGLSVADGQVLQLTMDEARSIAALCAPLLQEGLDGASLGTMDPRLPKGEDR